MMFSRIAMALAGVLTVLLVQATLISPLTFPVPVSLPALLVVIVAIYAGPGVGVGFGFAVGLVADLGSEHPAGVQALCWLGAGLLAGRVGGLAVGRRYGTRAVAGLAAVLAAGSSLAVTFILAVLGDPVPGLTSAVVWTLPIALTDALLGLLLVPLVRTLLRAYSIRPARADAVLLGRPADVVIRSGGSDGQRRSGAFR
jgi:rod shape-determining protein MreD